jgi:hypothetical protein
MNAEREHKYLAQADRHIAELKKDIARQRKLSNIYAAMTATCF